MLCEDCDQKVTCKEICKEVDKYLKDNNIWSANWIRPEISKNKRTDGYGKWREIPFSSINTRDKDGEYKEG